MEHEKPADHPVPSINQERERLGEPKRRAFPDRAVPQLRKPSLPERVMAKVRRQR
jgi:hypothetical protein